jgi:hypothetical protein
MSSGWSNIFWGALIIAIGLTMGGSVFTGNPSGLDYVFDGLGVFFVGLGIYQLLTKKTD